MGRKKLEIPEEKSVVSEKQIFENSIWMTVKDTANYLSRTENAVRILICRKILKAYHLGRTVYLKRSDIDTLIESSVFNGGY